MLNVEISWILFVEGYLKVEKNFKLYNNYVIIKMKIKLFFLVGIERMFFEFE